MSRTITESRILHALGAETTNNNGPEVTFTSRKGAAYLNATAKAGKSKAGKSKAGKSKAGKTPTLDAVIEEKDAASGLWFTIAIFSQLADAIGTERIEFFSATDKIRVSWMIGGIDASYTFSVGVNGKELR